MEIDIKVRDIPRAIIRAAALWYFQFDEDCSGGKAPPPERWEQLRDWLKTDPRHQAAYKHMQKAGDYFARVGVRAGRRGPPSTPS